MKKPAASKPVAKTPKAAAPADGAKPVRKRRKKLTADGLAKRIARDTAALAKLVPKNTKPKKA